MKRALKIVGVVIGGLVAAVLAAAGVLYAMGNSRLNKTYDFPPSNITLPTDEASLALGKHRVESLCSGCHGEDLGGLEDWFDSDQLGAIDSANLTSGEGGFGLEAASVEDYVRAIRHGIDPEGKPIFMPAVESTAHLSDEELGAIIAYIKSVPPVDHKVSGHAFKPLAKILLAVGVLGKLPVEAVSHDIQVSAPEAGPTADYGRYIVDTYDCRLCHGPDLNGGPYPDPTIQRISPNLTPGGELAAWSEADFVTAIRTGGTPSGHELDPELMPWTSYKNLYDDELKAVYAYLKSLPSLPQYTE